MTFVISAFQMYILHFGHFFESRENSGQNQVKMITRWPGRERRPKWPIDLVTQWPSSMSDTHSTQTAVRSMHRPTSEVQFFWLILIPIKDDTVAENWAKNQKGNRLHPLQSTHVLKWPVVKYKHIKIKPKMCILFIVCLTWTMNANSLKQNVIVIETNMFFLAATLVGWIVGDFVYRKVAAENIFVLSTDWSDEMPNSRRDLKTTAESWCHIVNIRTMATNRFQSQHILIKPQMAVQSWIHRVTVT